MVRVLHIVTDMRRGGLETMLMNYYRQIDRNKVQFDFLTHRDYRSNYDDEIERLGGKIYHVPKLNPFSNEYKQRLGLFFDENPDYQIIHVHQDCLSSVILKIAMEHGVRVRIAHSHANSQDKNLKYPIKLYYKQFIPRYATELMACSEEAGKWMFGKNGFSILNNAINTTQYLFDQNTRCVIRNELGIGKKEVVFGHIGRFSPPKNHAFLLSVVQEILTMTHAKLLLVGDGRLKSKIIEQAEKMGLKDSIIFTGVRPDVCNLLQAMDVFLLPSYYEGVGIAAVEAQASGLPCILSDGVSHVASIIPEVRVLSLQDGARKWAEEAIELCGMERRNTFQEITNAGFDIAENAKKLTDYYLELSQRC